MSKQKMFEALYKKGVTPWELDRPDANLIDIVKLYGIRPGKAMDIGCGTGSNAIWLAQNGFTVTGVDFSPLAVKKARVRAENEKVFLSFAVMDFLKERMDVCEFDFLFDRGCFHSFDGTKDRERFAENACQHLKSGGYWFSLSGNADGEPRDDGPPTRSAKEIVGPVEEYFEILLLESGMFDSTREDPSRCWKLFLKKRGR